MPDRKVLACLLALCIAPAARPVQAQEARAVVDSAQEARLAYRRAIDAARRGDLGSARAEMRRAAAAWPPQPAYVYGAASLAARARDTADALGWLERYAALGVSRDLAVDSGFASLAAHPRYQAIAREIAAHGAPLARSSVAFTIPDTMFHAEGIAYDPKRSRWLIGSVTRRRIVAVDGGGRVRDFVAAGAHGLLSVMGMAVDSTRDLLWVSTAAHSRMQGFAKELDGRSALLAFDLETGRLAKQLWLPTDSLGHALGDVAVAPNGDVYASDSRSPAIYRVRAGADSLGRFATHSLLRSPQGIVVDADREALYVADYSHGVVRVDLRTRDVRPIALRTRATVLGIDGLYRHGSSLVAIQNGVTPPRVVRLTLDGWGETETIAGVELLDRHLPPANEPTLGVVVGDSLFYIAEGQWEAIDADGRPLKGATLRPVTVLRLSLDERAARRPMRDGSPRR